MKYKDIFGNEREKTIENFITSSIDGADHERGALEETQATVDNAVKVIANLISLLEKKNLINESEIKELTKNIF